TCSAGWPAPSRRGRGPPAGRRGRHSRNGTRPAWQLLLEETGNPLDKGLGLLDFRMVPGALDQLEPRARDQAAIGATVIRRHDPVALAPQQQGRHLDPSEPARQLRVVHVWMPGIETQRLAV